MTEEIESNESKTRIATKRRWLLHLLVERAHTLSQIKWGNYLDLYPKSVDDVETHLSATYDKIIAHMNDRTNSHRIEMSTEIKSIEALRTYVFEHINTLISHFKFDPNKVCEIYGKWLAKIYHTHKLKFFNAKKLGTFSTHFYRMDCFRNWENDDKYDCFGNLISLMNLVEEDPDSEDDKNIDVSKATKWIYNFYLGMVESQDITEEHEERYNKWLCFVLVKTINKVFSVRICNLLTISIAPIKTIKETKKSLKDLHLLKTFWNQEYHTLESLSHFFNVVILEDEKLNKDALLSVLNELWNLGKIEKIFPQVVQRVFDWVESKEHREKALNILKGFMESRCNSENIDDFKTELDVALIELLSSSNLKAVRENFNILPPPERRLVLRGKFALCDVEKFQENVDNIYRIHKLHSRFQGNERKGDIIHLTDSVFEKPKWVDEDVNEEDSIQDILSKKRYVRVGSWNVACMNNTEVPTTEEMLRKKVESIAKVVLTSKCDIVALQELRLSFHIKNEEGKKECFEFEIFENKITTLLFELTDSRWEVEWTTSFYDDADGRKGRGVLAYLYNSDVVTLQQPSQTGLKVNDQRDENERFKRTPCIASFRVEKLEFSLCNVHIDPYNASKEIREMGKDLLPSIQSRYGALRSQSMIYMGDFNMSYCMNGAYASPKPDEETWKDFIEYGYKPCIRDCYTNVIQTCCYDNILIHKTMDSIRHIDKKSLGIAEKGVIEIKNILCDKGRVMLRSDLTSTFKKEASDHNLVFIDLRVQKAMPWSDDIIIPKEKVLSLWE